MNTALTKTKPAEKPSAVALMASRVNVDATKLYATLRSTCFKGASEEEMLALVVVANQYDLNPLLKEIYAFPAKGGGIAPVVSVDGWNKIMLRQPDFDGIEFEMQEGEDGPISCTATISVRGRSKPVRVTEYFDECKRNTDPWNNMPRRMLRNRTLCQAVRMAFGVAGVVHEDDAAIPGELPPKFVSVEATPADPVPVKQIAEMAQAEQSPQDTLAGIVIAGGFTFDQWRAWAVKEGQLTDAETPSFADVPAAVASRLVRAKAGMLRAMGEQP